MATNITFSSGTEIFAQHFPHAKKYIRWSCTVSLSPSHCAITGVRLNGINIFEGV